MKFLIVKFDEYYGTCLFDVSYGMWEQQSRCYGGGSRYCFDSKKEAEDFLNKRLKIFLEEEEEVLVLSEQELKDYNIMKGIIK